MIDLFIKYSCVTTKIQFQHENKLGGNEYIAVYKGSMIGSPVAIKYFELETLSVRSDFAEYEKINQHPMLLLFYGICDQVSKYYIVTELMPYSLCSFYKTFNLSWENIYDYGYQIAEGLRFIHYCKICHGNVTSNNVFSTNSFRIKIGDYGFSKARSILQSRGSQPQNLRWKAPETFQADYVLNPKSDVYSYGLLLWEMASRKIPYSTDSQDQATQKIISGITETIENIWPLHFRKLVSECWKVDTSRPSMDEIYQTFKQECFNLENATRARFNKL